MGDDFHRLRHPVEHTATLETLLCVLDRLHHRGIHGLTGGHRVLHGQLDGLECRQVALPQGEVQGFASLCDELGILGVQGGDALADVTLDDVGDVAVVGVRRRPLLAHVEVRVFLHSVEGLLPELLGVLDLLDEGLDEGCAGRTGLLGVTDDAADNRFCRLHRVNRDRLALVFVFHLEYLCSEAAHLQEIASRLVPLG